MGLGIDAGPYAHANEPLGTVIIVTAHTIDFDNIPIVVGKPCKSHKIRGGNSYKTITFGNGLNFGFG